MKSFTAVVLFLLIIGVSAPTQAQTPSGAVVGPIYYASLYGVFGDDSHNDTSAFQQLLTTIQNSDAVCMPNCGGTIQLPVTGNKTLIKSMLTIPANINIVGCGMEGSDIVTTYAPACGLDLQITDTNAKIYLQGSGHNIFRDLAIVDNETGPSADCTPFFYVTLAVVHFKNVSIRGTRSAKTDTPCNDGFILGGPTVSNCTGVYGVPNCFAGYGSTFQNISFSNTRMLFQLGTTSNGSDFDYIVADATNGYTSGSAVVIGAPGTSIPGAYPYGNTFKNVQIEQGNNGMPAATHYNYGMDFTQNAGLNYVFSINCSDIGPTALGCVHIAGLSFNVAHEMVAGCLPTGYPTSTGFCVVQDDLTMFTWDHLVLDPADSAIFARTYYGGNIGTKDYKFNYVHLYGGIDSPTNTTGIPNATTPFGGIVGFSNSAASAFGASPNIYYPLFSDTSAASPAPFTVFPFEVWLGQFTLNTSNTNGTAPIQLQPIYSLAGSAQASPIVLSIPAGGSPGTPITNAPPFYVSAGNQINFQAVNALPAHSTGFATVNGFAASILGNAQTVLGTYYNYQVLMGSPTTNYTGPSQKTSWANTTQNLSFVIVPFGYSAQGLCVYLGTAQQSGDRLVVTLQKNGSDTAALVTIPLSGGVGPWCDTHTVTGSAGDWIDFKVQNYDSSHLSGTIQSITLGMTPTAATGMLIFGLGGIGNIPPPGVNKNYFAPFGGGNVTTTAANAQVALPRAVTIKNMHCYVFTCPSTGNTATFHVYQNGGIPPITGSLTVAVPGGLCGAPKDFSDTSTTMNFAAGDTIELEEEQSSGTGPQVASCSVEHD